MTEEFREFLQTVLDGSQEDKIGLGKICINKMWHDLKDKGWEDMQITELVLDLTKLFVSSDLKWNEQEYEFFKAMVGDKIDVPVEDFVRITSGGRERSFVEKMLKFFHDQDGDARKGATLYGIALLSVDDTLESDELVLIDLIQNA